MNYNIAFITGYIAGYCEFTNDDFEIIDNALNSLIEKKQVTITIPLLLHICSNICQDAIIMKVDDKECVAYHEKQNILYIKDNKVYFHLCKGESMTDFY